MVNLDVFLTRLLPQIPACPEPLALEMLLDTCIEFCERSLVIRQNLDQFYSVPNLPYYDLDPPTSQHTITRVLDVKLDGKPLTGIFAEDVPELYDSTATPRAFYTSRTDNTLVLHLHPTPDSREKVVANVALRPTRTATQVDDDLFNLYSDAVVDGAIARIARVPDQPFTDIAHASAMLQSFRDKMMKAKTESYHGRIRGNTRVKMRPFA